MTVQLSDLKPADLLIVTGTADTSKLIEIGAILVGDPAASHVAGYTHTDAHGIPWGLEGRPGGLGWVDIRRYLRDPRTITNAAQPKTDKQRAEACAWTARLIGVRYAWKSGIFVDAIEAVEKIADIPEPFRTQIWASGAAGQLPGEVVCSSAWAWSYSKTGLAEPKPNDWEHVTPGNWSLFVEDRGWQG